MNSYWDSLIDNSLKVGNIVAVACASTSRHAPHVRDDQLVPTYWKFAGSANLADPPGYPDAST